MGCRASGREGWYRRFARATAVARIGPGGISRRAASLAALVVLAVLTIVPAADARRPIIAYVDGNDKLALYDAELGQMVAAPDLTIPKNVLHRFAVSHSGRYVVWSDSAKKIHLFDRGAGAEVSLPGIDVYQNPGGLTVSDTGLIGFDDNSNGPARVYDAIMGSFLDTGLAAGNGHRQTHLSGDGRLLATTCPTDCVVNSGGDADGYVQDLVSMQDTALPDNISGADARDEEHPCIDGDGSLVSFDVPIPIPNQVPSQTQRDVFLYDRAAGAVVDLPGLNDPAVGDRDCVLDGPGSHLGKYNQDNGDFTLYDLATKTVVPLPIAVPFPAWFTAPYPPPGPAAGGAAPGPAPPDGSSPGSAPAGTGPTPAISSLSLLRRSFRTRGPRSGTSFRYTLSTAALVRIVIERRTTGRRVGRTCRPASRRLRKRKACIRYVRRGTLIDDGRAGRNATRFSGLLNCRELPAGLYRARIVGTDSAGNPSPQRRIAFRVIRSRGAGGPTLCLSGSTVAPGGKLIATGAGWPRRAGVALMIGPAGSEADRAATVRTGRGGAFRKQLRISAKATPGRYAVLACRRSCRTKKVAPFRIKAP